jgi:uncharacterized protein (DUF433 family)
MAAAAPVLTPSEVAELSGAPRRLIEKAIEERVLSARFGSSPTLNRRVRRLLPTYSVVYAAALKGLGVKLSIAHKKELARAIAERPRAKRVKVAAAVELDISRLVGDAFERTEKYRAARDAFIVADAEVMGGTPVIRGTRLTVYAVLGRIEHGETVADILFDNPDLTREAIDAAVIFARTHPLVGRPGGRPWADRK